MACEKTITSQTNLQMDRREPKILYGLTSVSIVYSLCNRNVPPQNLGHVKPQRQVQPWRRPDDP